VKPPRDLETTVQEKKNPARRGAERGCHQWRDVSAMATLERPNTIKGTKKPKAHDA
jgi:hypothetical protein